MQTAIQVKYLSLAAEARIIRRLEKSRKQSAKWAREKQQVIKMAQERNFVHYETKAYILGSSQDDYKRYQARIEAKNHLSDIAAKMAKDGIPSSVKYQSGETRAVDDFLSLYNHRIQQVRPEARCAHLALGFLRGRSYISIENQSYDWPNWTRIEELITKYGDGDPRVLLQRFAQWKQEGEKRGLIHEPGPGGWDEAEKRGVYPTGKKADPRLSPPHGEPLLNHKGVLSAVKEFLGFAS